MQRYAQWGPTGFDSKGLNSERMGENPETGEPESRADWLVAPVGVNRDTAPGSIERSNFEVLLAQLRAAEPGGETWEKHGFNHWACGWFDILIVKPGSEAERIAQRAEDKIADYPALDEDDWSQREWEAHSEGLCEDGCSSCESEEQEHRGGHCQADCPLCYEEAEKEDFERT